MLTEHIQENVRAKERILQHDHFRFGEGLWIWDALTSNWFVHRSYICNINGDMLGSAKLSGLAGHLAHKGDRFSMVEAAKASPGTKAQYYPISCPDNKTLNPLRPGNYNLDKWPKHKSREYWLACEQLFDAITKVT